MNKKLNGIKMLIVILLLIAIIVTVFFIVNKVGNKEPEQPKEEEKSPVIQLPETTYSEMQVKNIQIEYLEDQNKSVLRFDILNTTEEKVESQRFTAILIGQDEEIIAEMPYVYIQSLDVNQQHALEVIYSGDATATTQIKLVKK